MTDTAPLASIAADLTGGRTSGLRFLDDEGTLAIVLDVTGLGIEERKPLEDKLRARLLEQSGVNEVRIAMTAEKKAMTIIAVGSGKGGVGKSTLAANLAVALRRLGVKVGLVDADIYGPSQPRLMDSENVKPEARGSKLAPVESAYGVPMLSTGQIAQPGQAIAWRGPMAGRALEQLVDASWGDIDTLVVDLPPGTGDVQLTMIQKHKPAGAVIVSTPQDLSLMDATRAIDMFRKMDVEVVGLVENMAGYACPHCGEVSDPFGTGGAEAAAGVMSVPFLGRIPLTMSIRRDSDAGRPPAAGDGEEAALFRQLAQKLLDQMNRKAN